MTILQNLKSAQLKARKDRDTITASLLTTLIGDAVMVGKNNGNRDSTDIEVIDTIKKFINNAQLTADALGPSSKNLDAYTAALNEINILREFLPKQLTEDEIHSIVENIITEIKATSIKDMGKVMKIIKETHAGTYDGTMVSNLVKQILGNLK